MKIKGLNLRLKELQKHIELKTDYWENPDTTNCYAYALGLDIPEYAVGENAYSLGTIGLKKIGVDPKFKLYYDKETRLIKDFDALKFKYQEVSPDEPIKDENKYSYFKICLMQNRSDFHFLRQSKTDNTWWHKQGWENKPSNKDDDGELITDPTKAKIRDYEYVKTYKIRFRRS